MHDLPIIKELVIILIVSVPIIFLFKKINIPSVVGFLIAGIIIGPYGFKLISEINQIEVMAEIGVLLLLFSIGLEISLKQLIEMKKFLLIAGGLQVLITIIISSVIFYLWGIQLNRAVFLGILISLSSTAVVLKLLSDKNELETPHGKISLGILIFQDLAIVPIFLLLPIFNSGDGFSIGGIIFQLFYAFAAVFIIILLAKYLMPKILFQLAKLRMREAFTVGTILLFLGTAYLTHTIGLSFALGAFVAGLILSESEFNHQVVSEIIPLKDVFNSIFFVSVGLLLNINFVITFPLLLLSASLLLIILKSSIITFIVKIIKYPLRVGIITGLGLAQIGEFSFVTAQVGLGLNLIDNEFYNALIACTIFTMVLTPFLQKLGEVIAYKSVIANEFNLTKVDKTLEDLHDHVIIVGFGVNGRNLASVLKEAGIKFIIVELNPETVKNEKRKGEKIIFGDITREEVLRSANIVSASVIVFTIPDSKSIKAGLQHVKKLNSNIYKIVRTRFVGEIEGFNKLGADYVIPEEFETSIEIFRTVLSKYHIPLNVIQQQVNLLRAESYKLMLKEPGEANPFININEILAAGLTETYYVDENNLHIGKSIGELNIRAKTEATIIAIVRENRTITSIVPNERLFAKDTLVITGNHNAVDKAIQLLSKEA